MAGKPQTLATTSAFEILGPVMVGPSSSHTAGALRCAQVAASLLEGRITKVTFGLWNSFAHTYRGHGTDRALVAGILGLDTDDENIKQAFNLAREQGLDYHLTSRATTPPSTPTPSTSRWSTTRAHGTGPRREPRRRQDAHQPHQRRRRRHLGHVFHALRGAPGRSRRARSAHEPARLRTREHRLLPHLSHRGGRPGLFRL